MATVTVARPGQSLRNRRDAPRPTLSKRSATNMDGTTIDADSSNKKRKLTEPFIRDSDFILRKHKGKPPSLVLHLYQTYFKFEGQDGSFSYDSPMRFILEHVKKQTVPHKMMEELLQSNVTFYDGCLIVEIQNHRGVGKDRGRHDSGVDGDTVKFSLHNYNPHVTPSPYAPYPSKAKEGHTPVKADSSNGEMAAPQRPKGKEEDGPKVSTVVLHPTEQTKHEEIKILANTPASEVRSKKKAGDNAATPSTPSTAVPPTPIGQAPRPASSQKMCLEEGDFYTFQADMLMATTEPLYLEPCDTPQQSDAIIDMLQHPNHQEKPPSPKTRKRTTAEVAADDAQAAEIERRMLIMDERIKATGAGNTAGETQGAANAMQFTRFKTIDMVRQKHEEAERAKKEEEARKAIEKKEAEEQLAQHTQQQKMLAQRQQQMLMAGQGNQQQHQQQQMLIQQRRAQAAQQAQAQQAALMNAQNHAHPPQNAMMQNQQQNFQQQGQVSMGQTSPVVRQQTPMMNSSPMVQQGGFAMAQTSSQGPGSPPRPTSGMQQQMARQMSQQQRTSNTPHVGQQGTPNMAQAMPNRQMTQTPRMPPGSPAAGMQHGTPASGAMHTPAVPQQGQLTPAQMEVLQQQSMSGQGNRMMPGQFQDISNMQRQQNMQAAMQRQAMMQAAQGNPQQMAALQQRQQQQQMHMRMLQQQQRQQQMIAQQQGQMQHAGSPGGMNGAMPTPQIAHGHPQQQQMQQQQHQQGMPNQQQQHPAQQQAQQAANMQVMQSLQPIIRQYGGAHNIPQSALQSLTPQQQTVIRRFIFQQRQQQQQQMIRAQQAQQQQRGGGQMTPGQAGGEQVPGGPGDPQYMAALRQQQQMLNQMQQHQHQQGGGGGGMNGMQGMAYQMGGNPGQGQQQQQGFGGQQQGGQGGQQQGDLSAQFMAMQQALNRGQ